MKYARTEDNKILEIGITTDYGFVIEPDCKLAYHFIDEQRNGKLVKVIEQSDDIEKLIDGYYLDIDNRSFESAYTFDVLYEALNERNGWLSYSNRKRLNYDIILYGFIKTDKGLIYVAKMNDKGELELL